MEQNTDTIQDMENDLDVDYEAKLAEIDKALEENARQMAEIEKALTELDKRKIFTLKELREMELEKQREEREKLENEKKQIDTITAESLKKAQLLRESVKNDEEKLLVEDEALNIELNAILHDLDIRKIILSENESELEDVLASLAIEECEYWKNNKASMTASKKTGDYYKLREKIYNIRNKKTSYLNKYAELNKIVEKQMCKIAEANKILKSIRQKSYH